MAHRSYASHVVMARAFGSRQCRRIVELGERAGLAGGLVGGDGEESDDGAVRRTQVAWLARDSTTEWVFTRLDALAERANRCWSFDLDGISEDLQFTRYDSPGAFYTWHQDGLQAAVADRKLAVVVQLSHPDDYDGGDLELFDVVSDWSGPQLDRWRGTVRAQGVAVAFPSFEYHRVTPVVTGRRDALVAWFSGPPFR